MFTVSITSVVIDNNYNVYYNIHRKEIFNFLKEGVYMKKGVLYSIIAVLLVIICCESIYIFVENKNSNSGVNKDNNNKQNEGLNNNVNENYIKYEKLEEIELKDGSKWTIIKDSDEKSDYVTALAMKNYDELIDSETSGKLRSEIYESYEKIDYDSSESKKYVDNLVKLFDVKLKEVDGYKIRLLKIEDIFEIDENFDYDGYDNYTYTGTKNLDNFLGMTMSNTKCDKNKSEKCTPFYYVDFTVCYNPEGCGDTKYFITNYTLGVGGFRPVINVYKSEIKR